MASIEDKENVVPSSQHGTPQQKTPPVSPTKRSRTRSKSIGPGSLDGPELPKISAKDRRKSAFVPATKSILSKIEESEKAARRKSMMNRRVSFAPEATLHTWDIVEYAKDHTTSTDSTESVRRVSGLTQPSSSPAAGSDISQAEEGAEQLSAARQKQKRRSSGIPPMNFNNPDDADLSNSSESEDESEAESENEDNEDADSEDDMSTAMSLDGAELTERSAAESEDSTGSSARLEASLRQAAQIAGTRGIEYDEYGEMSMELASEEITNAFKPWAQRAANASLSSASADQENINPFSSGFEADAQPQRNPAQEAQDEEDMSMDVTRAVGGILQHSAEQVVPSVSDDEGDGTMDLTQVVGKIHGQKRRRSTTDNGSPSSRHSGVQPKKRRSSAARSSISNDTMDLTMAVGAIQSTGSPVKTGTRRRSLRNRRSSGALSEQEDSTMDFTHGVGGIVNGSPSKDVADYEENEELSMELTVVLGGVSAETHDERRENSCPNTPQSPKSPLRAAAHTTPENQELLGNTPEDGAKTPTTPIPEEQEKDSTKKRYFLKEVRLSLSPQRMVSEGHSQNSASPRFSRTTSAGHKPKSSKTDSTDRDKKGAEVPLADGSIPRLSPQQRRARETSEDRPGLHSVFIQAPDQSPTVAKKHRKSPVKGQSATPEKLGASDDSRDLAASLRLLTTPRKEALKSFTPKKQYSAQQHSPVRTTTSQTKASFKAKDLTQDAPSPVRHLRDDIEKIKASDGAIAQVGLQDFLLKAGIRFMDLTTTKRRLTTAPTPSKTKSSSGEEESTIEDGVVAAACSVPELELYQHACHELKRYTREGKQMVSDLEAATLREQPPLIQAYMNAEPDRRAVLDAQMRDMKTDARLRSKELWYAWRSQLLDELMGGLQNIGEGLIKDDEILGVSEEILGQMLPPLLQRHSELQEEADRLERDVGDSSEQQMEQLSAARDRLGVVSIELGEKQKILGALRREAEEQDASIQNLRETKDELNAAIQEANRNREACRGISLNEITALKESVKHLEDVYGWAITSASSSPATVTMTYRSKLELYFHPAAFGQSSSDRNQQPNAPIRLTYVTEGLKPIPTTLRFFLQFLRASLLSLSQCSTKVASLLTFVSTSWEKATAIAEHERRLHLEALTESRIVSDERLAIESNILLAEVKTKVRATFEVSARLEIDGDDLRTDIAVAPTVTVVYGEQYKERNMQEYLRSFIDADSSNEWDHGLRGMREKLIARGPKGARK